MNSVKLIVPIYYSTKKETFLVGLNEYRNKHFQILNSLKRHYHYLILEQLQGQKTPKLMLNKVHISYKIYLKRGGTDGGNIRSVIEKFCLDAIKSYGLIKNDTFDIVSSDDSKYFKDAINPRAEIYIAFLIDN